MSEQETEKKDQELSDEELDKVSGGKNIAVPRPHPTTPQKPIGSPGGPIQVPGAGGPINT